MPTIVSLAKVTMTSIGISCDECSLDVASPSRDTNSNRDSCSEI